MKLVQCAPILMLAAAAFAANKPAPATATPAAPAATTASAKAPAAPVVSATPAAPAATVAAPAPAPAAPSPFASEKDKYSYAIGLEMGESMKKMEFEISMPQLLKGVQDIMDKDSTKVLLTPDQRKEVLAQLMQVMEQKRAQQDSIAAVAELAKVKTFLEKNKKEKGVITTKSGLEYTVLKKGTGASPKLTDQVTAHYVGTLLDGTEFDSSVKRGQPATFPLNGVIPGWQEMLPLMKVGDKVKCWIPSELGYGARGNQRIPPNSLLIFEIELIAIPVAETAKPQ